MRRWPPSRSASRSRPARAARDLPPGLALPEPPRLGPRHAAASRRRGRARRQLLRDPVRRRLGRRSTRIAARAAGAGGRHPPLRPRLLRQRPAAGREGGGALQPQHAADARPASAPPTAASTAGKAATTRSGCCLGSCTHVWNYEQATAFLFGALARSMREIEFLPRHPRRRPHELPRPPPARARAHGVGAGGRRRADGLPDEALPRLAALRRRGGAQEPVAAREALTSSSSRQNFSDGKIIRYNENTWI